MKERRTPEQLQAIVTDWVTAHIGPVLAISRQGRWRPAWFITAERNGEVIDLYVRGARTSRFPPMPLSYEAAAQQVFFEAGVKVAKVHGFIDAVPAVVMDRLPGRPDIATAENDAVRERLREQLADEMIKIHAIDPARIVALGAPTTDDPREVTLLHYRINETLYLEGDSLPSPDIEFVRAWIERNVPPSAEAPAVITVDSGQFLFEGSEVTGMIDLELVGVGDRHVDMAALRVRNLVEEIGDLDSFYDLYEARGGAKLDRDRIGFLGATFAFIVPLHVAHELAHPENGDEYYVYLMWHVQLMGIALRDVARLSGVTLKPYVLPDPKPDRIAMMLQALTDLIDNLPAEDEFEAYRRHDLSISAHYLREQAARRTQMEREYLDEIEALTGNRPADSWDGDQFLCAFVKTASAELDAPILQILFNRNERVDLLQRLHYVYRREGMEAE